MEVSILSPNCIYFITEVIISSSKRHTHRHAHKFKASSQGSKYLNFKELVSKEQISTGKGFSLDFLTYFQSFNIKVLKRAVQDCVYKGRTDFNKRNVDLL